MRQLAYGGCFAHSIYTNHHNHLRLIGNAESKPFTSSFLMFVEKGGNFLLRFVPILMCQDIYLWPPLSPEASMIFSVVATPTSDQSRPLLVHQEYFRRSLTYLQLALPNLKKKDFLEAERPLSNCSFFSGLKIDFKKLISVPIKKATVKVAYILD